MKLLLLFVVGIATTERINTPSGAECSRPVPQDGQSLLSSLLQASGYSDICIAASLDYCSSSQEDGHFASLMKVRVRGSPPKRGLIYEVFPNSFVLMKIFY